MQEQVIAAATPIFFIMMGVEWIVGRRRQRHPYRLNDTLSSLGLGIVSQLIGAFSLALRVGIYAQVQQNFALWKLAPANPLVWLGALAVYDLCYYWLHRMGHEVNILWAAHVVHHQSECYNLSTALRQTATGSALGWIFYLPMAILGFPTAVFAVVALIDLLYQFWIHTELIGRMGWFDRVFASPSNHRVHHAINDRYLDRNYGGILILWDRIFGTFQEEMDADPPSYGTRKPLRSWDPLWANVEVYWATATDALRTRRVLDKFLIWFRAPGWGPTDLQKRDLQPLPVMERTTFDPPLPDGLRNYCVLQFALILAMTVDFLSVQKSALAPQLMAYALYLGLCLWMVGGILACRVVAIGLEALRLLVSAAALFASGSWFGIATLSPLARGLAIATLAISLLGLLIACSNAKGKLRPRVVKVQAMERKEATSQSRRQSV